MHTMKENFLFEKKCYGSMDKRTSNRPSALSQAHKNSQEHDRNCMKGLFKQFFIQPRNLSLCKLAQDKNVKLANNYARL